MSEQIPQPENSMFGVDETTHLDDVAESSEGENEAEARDYHAEFIQESNRLKAEIAQVKEKEELSLDERRRIMDLSRELRDIKHAAAEVYNRAHDILITNGNKSPMSTEEAFNKAFEELAQERKAEQAMSEENLQHPDTEDNKTPQSPESTKEDSPTPTPERGWLSGLQGKIDSLNEVNTRLNRYGGDAAKNSMVHIQEQIDNAEAFRDAVLDMVNDGKTSSYTTAFKMVAEQWKKDGRPDPLEPISYTAETQSKPESEKNTSPVMIDPTHRELVPSAKGKELVLFDNDDNKGKEVELFDVHGHMNKLRAPYLEEVAKQQKNHWLGLRYSNNAALMWLEGKFPKVFSKIADLAGKREDRLDKLGWEYSDAMADVINRECLTDEERQQYLVLQLNKDALTVAAMQRENSKKPMNKWLRRAGYAASGIIAGVAAVPFGPFGALLAVGTGVSAAAAIRGMANKRNAQTETVNDEGNTVYVGDQNAHRIVNEFKESNPKTATELVNHLNDATGYEVKKNQRRILRPVLGALAAFLATRGTWEAYSHFSQSTAPVKPLGSMGKSFETKPPIEGLGKGVDTNTVTSGVFEVESGHGLTHELIDFANANGKDLSPEDSYELHQHLINVFGEDYINNIDNSSLADIYHEAGDVRLTAPGSAQWETGVTEEIQNWMTQRGLW